MSDTDTTTSAKPLRTPTGGRTSGLVGVSSLIVALSVFWIATENHYGKCVEAQVAKYPAIGVSAFNTEDTGPIKLAYDAERRAAVDKCKRFLFV
ncbi:MAG: hypothetical protein Q7T55_12935 [Solirubrobacteraceae bacterium]|nr:hypothetical protein [Solirubrobacteraceae bacterium]